MSIYIKGMKMPKEKSICVEIFADGGVHEFASPFLLGLASELPPHGRLGDLDALDTSVLQAGFSYALTRRKLRYTPGEIREKIQNAPTIIPADPEEGGADG